MGVNWCKTVTDMLHCKLLFYDYVYTYLYIYIYELIFEISNVHRQQHSQQHLQTDVFVEMSKFLRLKISQLEGDSNSSPSDSNVECSNPLSYRGQIFHICISRGRGFESHQGCAIFHIIKFQLFQEHLIIVEMGVVARTWLVFQFHVLPFTNICTPLVKMVVSQQLLSKMLVLAHHQSHKQCH